jgi:hypothetical protein
MTPENAHRSPIEAIEAALDMLPARQRVQAPRWLVPLAVSAIVFMVPWLVYLGFTLPSRVRSDNYDVAWLGFDTLLMVVIAALGVCAWRRHPAAGLLAAVAAAMLVIDAWFDVTTSSASGLPMALVLAFAGELPLAVICGWAAFAAERHRADAYAGMRQRWQHAVEAARAAAADGDAAVRRLSQPTTVPPSQ